MADFFKHPSELYTRNRPQCSSVLYRRCLVNSRTCMAQCGGDHLQLLRSTVVVLPATESYSCTWLDFFCLKDARIERRVPKHLFSEIDSVTGHLYLAKCRTCEGLAPQISDDMGYPDFNRAQN